MPPANPRPRRTAHGHTTGGNPNPIDVHVGGRVRLRRIFLGLSQQKLANAIGGITFQQIQKYESGANRISASRLFDLARVLDVPVAFFFDAMSNDIAANSPASIATSAIAPPAAELDQLAKRETLEFVRAYYRILNPSQRKLMFELLKTMAASDNAPPLGKGIDVGNLA